MRECLLAPHDPLLKLTDMKGKLQKVVTKGIQLIDETTTNDDPKRMILLNRAKHGLKIFEVSINKLLKKK